MFHTSSGANGAPITDIQIRQLQEGLHSRVLEAGADLRVRTHENGGPRAGVCALKERTESRIYEQDDDSFDDTSPK